MKDCKSVKAPKAKTPPAKRMAEGGPATNAEHQRAMPRQMGQSGGFLATANRKLQGIPDQKRKVDDSPATMAKNRAAARRK